ncbi:probable sodium metabolite cotransporter BASS5, chloroplastic isoform X1 [Olea europaea subsp. europaea]|uniref:Probable sodium metabolite cotransporter BASS5, chloroplastic isoform X1 n=1 Tax=Olea europaea subsp. europaea TaxID=158383 RepID=A0A8S0SA58_OLEEU|nr:probable sodium metabolite cotransporter BASS5, chloroplastic isoform X1 [Olea europaea subsp. europaea]
MSSTSQFLQLHHHHHFQIHKPIKLCIKPNKIFTTIVPKERSYFSGLRMLGPPYHLGSVPTCGNSRSLISKCWAENFLEKDSSSNYTSQPAKVSFVEILKGANSILPQVVLASTILALIYPPSFTWFTNRYYAPALGFLMFAVGVNSSEKDFLEAFNRPAAIFAGYVGQFIVKPLLGYLFGMISMSIFGLPTSLAAGIMLTSCVSGAQLSNYATFLTDPLMAPLSIVMTSLSTATAVLVTPFLSLLLIGKRLPVDVKGMVSNIVQIVVTPIAAGLLLNRFFPRICNAIRPLLPPLSVFVTALCVGAPLAINIKSVMSPSGISVLLLVIAFHLSAFISGYSLAGVVFHDAPDVKALQRTLSYETGMQSSLLALALANKFFQDPLVSVPPAISTVIMSLMGFSLVMLWSQRK